MNEMNFSIHCKCGGSLRFKVSSVSSDKQYICPNCSLDLGNEVIHTLIGIKDSLKHHCESCSPLNNVRSVNLRGKLL